MSGIEVGLAVGEIVELKQRIGELETENEKLRGFRDYYYAECERNGALEVRCARYREEREAARDACEVRNKQLAERDATIAAMREALEEYDRKLQEVWGKESEPHAVAYGWTKSLRDTALSSDAGKDFEVRIRVEEQSRTEDLAWNEAVEACQGRANAEGLLFLEEQFEGLKREVKP